MHAPENSTLISFHRRFSNRRSLGVVFASTALCRKHLAFWLVHMSGFFFLPGQHGMYCCVSCLYLFCTAAHCGNYASLTNSLVFTLHFPRGPLLPVFSNSCGLRIVLFSVSFISCYLQDLESTAFSYRFFLCSLISDMVKNSTALPKEAFVCACASVIPQKKLLPS